MPQLLKPLTHWAIYKGYTIRYQSRSPERVSGILITEEGNRSFEYDPSTMAIRLEQEIISINEHGWELESAQSDGQDTQ